MKSSEEMVKEILYKSVESGYKILHAGPKNGVANAIPSNPSVAWEHIKNNRDAQIILEGNSGDKAELLIDLDVNNGIVVSVEPVNEILEKIVRDAVNLKE